MNQYGKVAYYTLGCKLNFSETSTIARQLSNSGFARVDFEDRPDVFVINTCSVTENANRKCRNIVRRAKAINPESKIAVIGCYAQLKPEEIAEIPGVNIVLGAKEKFDLVNFLQRDENVVQTSEIKATRDFVPSFSIGDRTRSFLKVQDGCNYFCAFCTIPLARGRSRSANIEETLVEANKVAATDINEVVLTGVNIGDFGTAHDETFFDLVKDLDNVEGIDRFRISSIEPNLLGDEIIEFVATSKRFMPHFHIPLQSGSDNILKGMRRRYLTDLYRERVLKIKTLMPHACIGVDVIVGFPGETDEEFDKTVEFLKSLPVSYLHVFTYSERENTTALRIGDVVPHQKRNERSKILRMLSLKKKRAFYEENCGRKEKVLFESSNQDGFVHGFSANYIKVRIPYEESLTNQVRWVKIGEIDHEGFASVESIDNLAG